jgi:hypothetical protein
LSNQDGTGPSAASWSAAQGALTSYLLFAQALPRCASPMRNNSAWRPRHLFVRYRTSAGRRLAQCGAPNQYRTPGVLPRLAVPRMPVYRASGKGFKATAEKRNKSPCILQYRKSFFSNMLPRGASGGAPISRSLSAGCLQVVGLRRAGASGVPKAVPALHDAASFARVFPFAACRDEAVKRGSAATAARRNKRRHCFGGRRAATPSRLTLAPPGFTAADTGEAGPVLDPSQLCLPAWYHMYRYGARAVVGRPPGARIARQLSLIMMLMILFST